MRMNVKRIKYIRLRPIVVVMALISAILFPMEGMSALTAQQVAQKAAAVVSNAKGISASFTVTVNGQASKGVIKSAGQKFSVILPQVSTWYNGKTMYTYNPRTSETTLTDPTAQELLESNPLLYVKGGGGGYTCSFSTSKKTGKYIVDLVPRNKRAGIKKLTFTINAKTFYPEKITVSASGGTTVVDVTSFKAGVDIPSSSFEYPRAKYPKSEIVDLR